MTSSGGPATPSSDHRPALDGLRALAVAAVLLFHVDRLPGGNLGVDAFFVLSGWLITWRLLAEADRAPSGRIDLRRFWGARARRLMPASLAVVVAVAAVWSMAGIDVPSLRRDLVFAIGWSSNWGTISAGGDYWSRFGEPSPIAHFWSLAIEEQFYLVWPVVIVLLIAAFGRRRRAAVGVVSALLSLGSIAFMVAHFDPSDATATYMHTVARAHSLLIGATAAAMTASIGPALRGAQLARRAAPIAGLVAIAIVLGSSSDSTWLFSWGFPLFAVAMAVVVVAAADGAGARILAAPAMRWIGDRSYGIYLWHWPVILFLSGSRTPLDGIMLDALRIALSVGLAAASYRWLEMPIRRRQPLGAWWSPGIAVGALAGSAAIVLFTLPASPSAAAPSTVTLAPATSPEPAPTTPTVPAASSSTAATTTPAVAAPVDGEGATSAVVAVRTDAPSTTADDGAHRPVRVLVAGDSTALHLSEALLPYASAHPGEIVAGNASYPGCGLTASADGRMHEFSQSDGSRELIDLSGCTGEWASVLDRVGGTEQIDVVLVEIGAWDAVDIHLADGQVVSVADPVGRALVAEAYSAFVDRVEEAGARVVWVRPADAHMGWRAIDAPVNDPARWSAMREIIDGLGVEQIDLPSWLALNGLDGPDGRPDGIHLTPQLNERFVQEVVAPTLVALAE
ncbi:MAG: acyltransferase family protein [Ilumatobacteraceae bacterium]